MLPPQTFIPVPFNLAEGWSRWNWAKGCGEWIVWRGVGGDMGEWIWGGEWDIISAAKQSRHLFRNGDLPTHGGPGSREPRGQTHFRKSSRKKKNHGAAMCADKRGTGCITGLPRIPIIETTQWHAGQFSAPLLKWSPIQFYVGHL